MKGAAKKVTGSIAFIGAGNMGEAIIRGLIESDLLHPDKIIASDTRKDRLSYLETRYRISTAPDNLKAIEKAKIILLAVKPQNILKVAEEISKYIAPDMLVISIAAGVSLARLNGLLGGTNRIVRVMPNTPALVLQGVTCVCTDDADNGDIETVEAIFKSIGKVVFVEERHMDAVTGLSGSGPAYFFLILEALADGGVKMGLPRTVALDLAVQTMKGSAALIAEFARHPGELKDMVASPGGTTIWGLHALEKMGVRGALIEAVESATLRSRELGKN
ncbi:pyrroline-5-carboxylate reductase [bacterium]|nr:pyrroline-5-carboxylate reductase [bacterium]